MSEFELEFWSDDDVDAPHNPVCPRCFLVMANSGTCGCNE